jgi:PIN domain nuclease of toxin-antitoxin system
VGYQSLIVLDTHALVWWYAAPERLSDRARRALRGAEREGVITASTISLLEIATAVRRGRLELGEPMQSWLQDLQRMPELRLEPVSASIAGAAGALPETLHGDPIDRIIVATAAALGAKLVTADRLLRRSTLVDTVW